MNINPATANMAQQYSNNLQATATQTKTPEQSPELQMQQVVPQEPSLRQCGAPRAAHRESKGAEDRC